ncbi:MAG: AraC family transcriptional regulator [Clostridiales bacterium]|jgi:AraC family transcriptional regulator|nr:AraC family transcriptional regulator [Clostridiales bacterium]
MDLTICLNNAVDVIEAGLSEEIDMKDVARAACMSISQLQRIFGFVCGIPVSEYIRRRRLTLAAFDLIAGAKVLDVALKYGYGSADAFGRAFQALHGLKPSRAKLIGAKLTAYPRIAFALTLKGVISMNYRIEEKKAFTAIGVKRFFTFENGDNFKQIPKMWEEIQKNAELSKKLIELNDVEPAGVIGLCADMYDNGMDYWVAVASTAARPEGLDSIDVSACTFAVFEARGSLPGSIQDVFKRIYSEWFPSSGYEHAIAPEIEWYSDGDMNADDYLCEAWIPVVKKP